MILLIGAVAVIYIATVLVSGTPEYLIPGAILLVLILGYAGVNRALTKKELARHDGDLLEAQRDDQDWAIPSAHLVADDETAAGDTPEVHNEINPHDLPIDHPGRPAAERQAAIAQADVTSGNVEGGAGGDVMSGEDQTAERTGEEQHSARFAKTAGGTESSGANPGSGEPWTVHSAEDTERPST
jgi:hypothetical protein